MKSELRLNRDKACSLLKRAMVFCRLVMAKQNYKQLYIISLCTYALRIAFGVFHATHVVMLAGNETMILNHGAAPKHRTSHRT
jgi:hypothetical protein